MIAMLRICIADENNPLPGGRTSAGNARLTLDAHAAHGARYASLGGTVGAALPDPPRLSTEALMEQHEETNPTSYPLGRGYGHDYMRGGEVFGGYGYREREDYARTRGGDTTDPADAELGEGLALAAARHDA